VAYLDPRGPSVEFYEQLQALLVTGRVRAICISTSTAAIQETARIAAIAARSTPDALVVVGGPHENDVEVKVAGRLPGVHLSIGGESGSALRWCLERYLEGKGDSQAFMQALHPSELQAANLCGRFTVASCAWPAPILFDRGPSRYSDPRPLVFPESYPKFGVFDAPATIPLMVSRGCAYGRCTFCAESNRDGGVVRTSDYHWVRELAATQPDAALYFQDSIFPAGNGSSSQLLPLLRDLDRPWGCQVYLPTLTETRVAELAANGCRYIYTGLESGARQVVTGIRKPDLTPDVAIQRMRWVAASDLQVGISLMFGSMSVTGELLETTSALQETQDLAHRIADLGVSIAGFYPNVQTVLPGTALARGLAQSAFELDFYHMPRTPIFDALEDGGVGYNFLSLNDACGDRLQLAERIVQVGREVQGLGRQPW